MNDKIVVTICLTAIAITLVLNLKLFLASETLTSQIIYVLSNIVSGLLGIATGSVLDWKKIIRERKKQVNKNKDII